MTTLRREPDIEHTVGLLRMLFNERAPKDVAFRLWDGSVWPDEEPRAATIVLKHANSVRQMFATGTEKALAEAYLHDDFDVEGDIETACELADALAEGGSGGWLTAAKRTFHLRRPVPVVLHSRAWLGGKEATGPRHSRSRDREAVSFHYDVSNEFYRLWLDPRMLYSCAYFEQEHDDLAAAQTAKLRHICRKLRLKPGDRLLDIGCGWGGLAIYAAQAFGVEVVGVTLSQRQAGLAAERVLQAGLGAKVGIELKDYRDLDETKSFDAIVSVGMAEHVGERGLPEYFRKAFDLLKPGGVFLNHAIGEGVRARPSRGPSFIDEYVFPDSELPRIPQVAAAAEAVGFEVRDVENLREHYMLTLRHWVKRLEAAHEAALYFVNEPTYRTWRLYMAASAHGFERGRLAVYQTLLSKADACGRAHLPMTRRDWYGADERLP